MLGYHLLIELTSLLEVLLTAKCYQILSGQVVTENRQTASRLDAKASTELLRASKDLMEMLVAQQRKLHESFYPPARSELVMSEDIAAHEF